jgi:ubiquinone biosynthesis protein Coq4
MPYKYINEITSPENLQNFLELVDLAAGSGQDVSNVFELGRRLRDSPQMQLCVRAIQYEPSSAQMLKEKYVGPDYNLDAMLKMPKGSLGWTFAKVLSTLGYDPQFYDVPPSIEEDADYISLRILKTHDIHHIITGFSLDNFGELGVISVITAQTRFPSFLFIDLLSLFLGFFTSDKLYIEATNAEEQRKTLKYKFDLISDGLTMGQSAKPLFPIKWEEGLERPLDEWREELNIQPVTDGPYSWYSHPALQL